jgi:hypothetical protein
MSHVVYTLLDMASSVHYVYGTCMGEKLAFVHCFIKFYFVDVPHLLICLSVEVPLSHVLCREEEGWGSYYRDALSGFAHAL